MNKMIAYTLIMLALCQLCTSNWAPVNLNFQKDRLKATKKPVRLNVYLYDVYQIRPRRSIPDEINTGFNSPLLQRINDIAVS